MKRRKLRWRRIAIVVGIVFTLYVAIEIWLAGRGDVLPPQPATIPITLHGGHVLGNRITTKSWSFDYDHAQMSPDGLTGSVEGVRNGIIFRHGKPHLHISAEHVQVDVQSLDFTALGKVHLERVDDPQHRSFDTDLVLWTNDAKLLRMPHISYVHTGSQTLDVSGITVNFDTDSIHFDKIYGGVDIHK
jgi:hypothetical protein